MTKIKEVKASSTIKEKSNKSGTNKSEGNSIWEKLSFVPIIIILGIVPLIVRLKIQSATGQDMSYALGNSYSDVFTYWKSNVIFSVALMMIIVAFFLFRKADIKSNKHIKIATGAIVIFTLVSLISALLSSHITLVWWGQYGLRGGFVTILSYAIISLYSIYFYKKKEDIRYILLPLGMMAILEAIIIFSQFIGKDIIFSDFVKSLIIPSEYGNIRETMSLSIEGKAYGTLFNPNYVGSFGALLLPIFILSGAKSKDIKLRWTYILVAIVLVFDVFASGSRAGIIGIGFSLIGAIALLGKMIIQKPRFLGIIMTGFVIIITFLNIATGGMVLERVGSIVGEIASIIGHSEKEVLANSVVKNVYINDKLLSIDIMGGKQINLTIDKDDKAILTDENNNKIDYKIENDKYIIPDLPYDIDLRFQIGKLNDNGQDRNIYVLEINKERWVVAAMIEGKMISLDGYGNPIVIEKAESIGFAGKEHIGSNRGYIWSRSLPILRDNLIFGVGPDAFVAEFPHGDIVVRNAVYGEAGIIVDKPHNLYLQIGINQGIIALVAFLVLNGAYIVNSFKVYFGKKEYSFHDMFGIGIMLGVIGYLGAGMFNDSVVSVAPLYWCLLGIGFAVNYINSVDSCGQ